MNMKFLTILTLIIVYAAPVFSDGYDDPFTSNINEGAIGSGYDDPFTRDINEGAIGSGYDDPFTPDVNEGAW